MVKPFHALRQMKVRKDGHLEFTAPKNLYKCQEMLFSAMVKCAALEQQQEKMKASIKQLKYIISQQETDISDYQSCIEELDGILNDAR